MATRNNRVGLRWRTLWTLAAVLLVGVALAWLLVSAQLREDIATHLRARALIVGKALEASPDVARALQMQDEAAGLAALTPLLDADQELVYLVVVDAQGDPVTWAARAGPSGDLLATREGRAQLVAEHVRDADPALVRAVVPLRSTAAETALTAEEQLLDDVAAKRAGAWRRAGQVLVGLSPELQLRRMATTLGAATVFAALAVLALSWMNFGRLFERLGRLRGYAEQLAGGDLSQRIAERQGDEIGELAMSLENISASLGEMFARVRAASIHLEALSRQVREASQHISHASQGQALSVRETREAMADMESSSQALASQIQELTAVAEQSTERMEKISAAMEKVSQIVHRLRATTDTTLQQFEQGNQTLVDVDRAVDRMTEASSLTATAMHQMSASAHSVGRSTEQARQVAQTAAERAHTGAEAVRQTLQAIRRIREFSDESNVTIGRLSEKVTSIEDILRVINEIANQTRLLSLNASIIAAQAGEHGSGLLVVADEIKALAAKTAGATDQIATLVNEVLAQSSNVQSLVAKGRTTVDEAVALSEDADHVLADIVGTSENTGVIVRDIAAAMAEQAASAEQVQRAMENVRTTAEGLRQRVSAQMSSNLELQGAIREMQQLMAESLSTVQEQSTGASEAIASTGRIFEQIRVIAQMNRQQADSRTQLGKAFTTLQELSQRNQQGATKLAQAVELAESQSRELSRGVQQIRV